jgi:hypothetical protein
MNMVPNIGTVAPPTCPPSDIIGHQVECRSTFKPWLEGLLAMAESAGWNRRTVASTLMFLSAQSASRPPLARDRQG